MTILKTAGAITVCLATAGCAQSTLIRSLPSGALVFVNGRSVGETPVELVVSQSEFSDQTFTARLEKQGYEPAEGALRKQVCGGRIVGGVFSLGISFIFKRPTCFSSTQTFSLTPLPADASRKDASGEPVGRPLSVHERLERLRKMREEGLITEGEYQHYRKEILNGL